MAIVFELVVNCGPDETSAQVFAENISKRLTDFRVRNFPVSFHRPLFDRIQNNNTQAILVSVIPKNIGYAVGLDVGGIRIPLTSEELTELGNKLYDSIRGVPGYRIGLVGWDVDYMVDYEELKNAWGEELAEGTIDGLVLANDLLLDLPGKQHFMMFDAEHSWIPYEGTRALE